MKYVLVNSFNNEVIGIFTSIERAKEMQKLANDFTYIKKMI